MHPVSLSSAFFILFLSSSISTVCCLYHRHCFPPNLQSCQDCLGQVSHASLCNSTVSVVIMSDKYSQFGETLTQCCRMSVCLSVSGISLQNLGNCPQKVVFDHMWGNPLNLYMSLLSKCFNWQLWGHFSELYVKIPVTFTSDYTKVLLSCVKMTFYFGYCS